MGNFVLQCMLLLVAVHGLFQCSAQNNRQMIDVRLAGGSNSSSGIVELRSLIPPTGWQDFFCSYSSFHIRMSEVMCRMLGFETYSSYRNFRNGNSLSTPFCNGDERNTNNECNASNHFTTHCNYRYEITCSTCEIGAVRLTNGLSPEQGIVEICLNGSWFRLCGRNWNYWNTLVVCRQLGYPDTKAENKLFQTYHDPHTDYILSNLIYYCVGDENSLYNCNSGTSNFCERYNSLRESSYVFVLCKGEIAEDCTNGAIRLTGGRDQYEGRVEVCRNKLWITVSKSGWDSNDAMVACRQLGLLQPTRVTIFSFNPEEEPIFFHQMECYGNESSLDQCLETTAIRFVNSFSKSAGVKCQLNSSPVYTNCDNDIRLVGGNSVSEGRVEMCFNGVWGSICNYGWDNIDATVVCKKLGFQAENSTAINDLRYGEGSGPYLLYDVNCTGHERNLTECQYGNSQIGYHACSSKQDAGVICDASTCHHGDVRLFGGYSKSDGIAETCINGQWTSICSQGWDEIDSIKFCRQLLGRENVVAPYSTCCSKIQSTSVAAVNYVRCNSSPSTRFVHCSYEEGYNSSNCPLTIVGCYVNDNCNYGSVRLVNGRTRNEGIVEVCLNGVWSTIKSYGWNTPDAEVVCRQLGMSWEWSQYYYVGLRNNVHYSPSSLYDVNCVGDEDMLLNCVYSRLSSSQLLRPPYSIAAVLCQGSATQSNNPNECISGEVRLANSSNNIEGRVEICTERMWVSVCDRYWGMNETRAFCKQLLGHPAKGSFNVTGGYYGTGNCPIIGGVNCRNSNSFTSCRINHQGNCSHGEEVGVVCQESYYAITVTSFTDPPFELGSKVKLHCSIDPDPSVGRPVRLHYRWTGIKEFIYFTSYSPNITVFIPVTHYKTSYYFCEVSVNNSVIGVGSIFIETKDILNPVDVPPSQSHRFHFTLAVNVSDQIQSIVRELNWYFNGNLLTNSSYTELTNGNKTLMTTVGNPGVYEVRYDGLLELPHNHECESMLLNAMRQYPMFKPVKFHVNTTEELFPQTNTIRTLWRNSAEDVIFTDGDDITLYAVGQTYLFVEQRDHFSIRWFVNGRYGNYRNTYYNNIGDNAKFSSSYRIPNAAYQSSGKYEAHLVWSNHNDDCNPYYNSLSQERFFHLRPVILAKSSIELKYYESLNHSFSATKSSLSSSEVSLLTCSATIHYPPLTSISIVKNEIVLKTAVNTTLTVSTDRLGVSPFGSYQCRVNATGIPFTRELMIKERVSLRIELQIKQPLKCSRAYGFVIMMKSSIATKLSDDCSCNVITYDLRDTQIVCNSESSVIFTTLLVFSTESGNETASTLANRLSGQVSFSALTIDINGSEALITTAVITSSTAGRNSDSVGTNIGVFIGGVIFSAVFIALFIIIIMICRRRSFKNSNSIAMSEDVRYSSGKSEVNVNLKDDSKEVQETKKDDEEISIKKDDD